MYTVLGSVTQDGELPYLGATWDMVRMTLRSSSQHLEQFSICTTATTRQTQTEVGFQRGVETGKIRFSLRLNPWSGLSHRGADMVLYKFSVTGVGGGSVRVKGQL